MYGKKWQKTRRRGRKKKKLKLFKKDRGQKEALYTFKECMYI